MTIRDLEHLYRHAELPPAPVRTGVSASLELYDKKMREKTLKQVQGDVRKFK